jgi:hypothetical protein
LALWHRPLDPSPLICSIAATLKFACFAVTIGYALCGLGAWLKRAPAAD